MDIPYTINHVDVVGEAAEQCVEIRMKVVLEVLNEGFMLVPLLAQNVAVLKKEVEGPEVMHMAVTRGSHTLIANGKGVYTVDLVLGVPFTSTIKQAVVIPCPECLNTTCTFTVPSEENVTLHVSPSVASSQENSKLTATLPPTKNINIRWTSTGPSIAATPVSMTTLTPTSSSDKKEEKQEDTPPPKAKERVITSGQEVLHSIGGGVCRTRLAQTYQVTNGNVASFQLKVGKHGSASLSVGKDWVKSLADVNHVKIISAEGPSLRTWDYTDDVLTLNLDSNTEGVCSFTITAELDLCSTSCHLHLPTFIPLNVNRNKGAVAIQGRTAVEIIEGEAKYISKVDVAELPPDLKRESNVLFAFKYLVSNHRLCLDAIKHDDVEVIIALCESATYKVTHTGEQLLYDLSFNIKNTQCQFAKIFLPPNASVWSALVGGESVKPAVDGSGKTLLPLIKGSDVAFNATLVFITPAPVLPSEKKLINSLLFTLPTIDLPVTHLRMELWLPTSHIYSAFDGAIDEVAYFNEDSVLQDVHNVNAYAARFSHSRPCAKQKKGLAFGNVGRNRRRKMEVNVLHAPQQQMLQQQQQMMPNMMNQIQSQQPQMHTRMSSLSRMSMSSLYEDEDDEDMELEEEEDAPMGGGMAQGIKPLNVSTHSLRQGNRHLFEKLLIPSGTVMTLSCDTTQAVRAKERTVQSDKGDKPSCRIM